MKRQRLFPKNIGLVLVSVVILLVSIFRFTPSFAHHSPSHSTAAIYASNPTEIMAGKPKTPTTAQATKSLYERLGGYNAIAAVVDDALPRIVNNPKLARFFVGISDNSKQRIRQLLVDQICLATGGPCVYTGRNMVTVHKGIGINNSEFDAFAADVVTSLDKFKVPAQEKGELVNIVASLRGEIVEQR